MSPPHEGAQSPSEIEPPQGPYTGAAAESRQHGWPLALILFGLTLFSVFLTGALYGAKEPPASLLDMVRMLPSGWRFAVPLLSILLVHEFGHYFAAKHHGVAVSPPFFLPAPIVSPFGTLGAIISMRDRIRSRNALLDIGAAGPLAGLVVALPVIAIGIATSDVSPLTSFVHDGVEHATYVQEGQSLLYVAMKRVICGPIPAGWDLNMNAVAFAGWVGLFVTALNLIPIGQLDGGHIAYALFGERQNRYARIVHFALLGAMLYNLARFVLPVLGDWDAVARGVGNSLFYLVWFVVLGLMRRFSGGNHPPTDPSVLSPRRRWIALGCLALFVLLFMPTPWAELPVPR